MYENENHMSIKAEIKGFKKIGRKIDGLKRDVKKQDYTLIRKALRKGMIVIRDEAKAQAPVGLSRDLRSSIAVYPKKTKGRAPGFHVGPNPKSKRYAYYGHMIEFGTKEHTARKAPMMQFEKGGQRIRALTVKGVKPQPFMTPAFRSKADDVIKVAGREFWKLFKDKAK